MENPFVKLFAIDFKDHLEVKKSGNTELKYVSWAYAWAEVKKLYPAASYEVKKFNGLPYVYDPITGFMVYTTVTIEGVSHEMWLPVLDSSNKAMKAVPYTYTTRNGTTILKPAAVKRSAWKTHRRSSLYVRCE